jgi:hypothetical protein
MKYTYFIAYVVSTTKGSGPGNNVITIYQKMDSLESIRNAEKVLIASIEGCLGLCITNFRLLKEEKV